MKTAIVYDRVNKFGGAERVLLSLHKIFPKAPLYTSVYEPKNAEWAEVFEVRTSFLNKIKFLRNKHEFLAPIMPFIFKSFNFDRYDLVISVTSEFAKNIDVNSKHLCYCLTPTRYLWSHHGEYFENRYLKILTKPLVNYLRKVDKEAAKKPDEMIAISTEVQKRIKKYYKREAKILFPPVDIIASYKNFENLRTSWPDLSKFSPIRQNKNGYYLIVSRLVKYKKVDLAIRAFNELKLPLVIVGSGREENKLQMIAKENIKFLGNVSDGELAKIYKGAKGFIFPQTEDFGIAAVEAQMHGIPVIAYKNGGSEDTVSNKTGVFFEKQTTKDLIKAIKRFEKKRFKKSDLVKNAERFSEKRFRIEFLEQVEKLC